ncbi:hypothetical protein RCL1_005806 [Eukaryota sp. TZLM3-RCL]
MRPIKVEEFVNIPTDVTVQIKNRNVTVKGPRGELHRDLSHQTVDMAVEGQRVRVTCFFGNKKKIAAVRSLCAHVKNMITGVVKGYKYTMRAAYAHFPISTVIADDNSSIEIRNFIGERYNRFVKMSEGVTVHRSENKDEIFLQGNDIEEVSKCAASIQESTKAKNKDIRKFLDGIYVSERGHVVMDD